MSILVEKYALPTNPFLPQELDPLKRSEDAELLLPVDGFNKLGTISDTIQTLANANVGALFFLVTGRNGAGRTSAARHILDAYRKTRDLNPERFVVPEVSIRSEDPVETLQRWSAFLVNRIAASPVRMPPNVAQEVMNAAANPARNLSAPVLQGALAPLAATMQKVKGGATFAVHLEDIRNNEMVDSVFDIFDPINTVVVMTVTDYGARQQGTIEHFKDGINERVIEHFKGKDKVKRGALVNLDPIQGAEAKMLILHRWSSVSAESPPFSEAGLEAAFGDKPRTVARVLTLVNDVLTARARLVASPGPWPGNEELGLSDEQLRGYIKDREENSE